MFATVPYMLDPYPQHLPQRTLTRGITVIMLQNCDYEKTHII
ncbi:hypothetical protein APHNP_1802 [Anaplasma phagocytophilum str. ApNP]|uniref:Uncharacterized protein n=1 Tax=Anaplasma phagocytophilum str. ApNP TaxID=1359153 RepID=A0A0F3NIN9_ANAPH|nr:hypothetical protein APHNP_1802 [Anaplasma phagocytophilum str. ApNP]